jgi:hypothetical protein
MNQLHVGFSKQIDLPKGSFLYIYDLIPSHPKAKWFDSLKHSLNPPEEHRPKDRADLANVLYAASPQGENTLTVRNGRRQS